MAQKPPERERCATGIEGLDTILYGGIPRSNTILLTGSCGTGKTSLALEFLIHGASKGENSLFISVTEDSEKLLANIIPYKFFDKSLIRSGRLVFIDLPIMYERLGMTKSELSMEEIDLLVSSIANLASELGTKRVVVDSITSVCYKLKTSEKIRDFILKLGKSLSDAHRYSWGRWRPTRLPTRASGWRRQSQTVSF
jgi:circadian clock protein KaiC